MRKHTLQPGRSKETAQPKETIVPLPPPVTRLFLDLRKNYHGKLEAAKAQYERTVEALEAAHNEQMGIALAGYVAGLAPAVVGSVQLSADCLTVTIVKDESTNAAPAQTT